MRETTRNRLLLGTAWALLIAVGILWCFILHPSALIAWAALIVCCIVLSLHDATSDDLPLEFWKCAMIFGIGISVLLAFFWPALLGCGLNNWCTSCLFAVLIITMSFVDRTETSANPIHIRGRRVVEYTSVECTVQHSVHQQKRDTDVSSSN